MKRVLIIGCGGAGKSTFAIKLNKILNLELIHLDKIYWQPNWVETPRDEFRPIIKELIAREEWIIDGNYNNTLDMRLERADGVIFLNISTTRCLWNAGKRIIKERVFHIKRVDEINRCPERFNYDFLKWIWQYNKKIRYEYLIKLNNIKNKKVYILNNYKEADLFLEKIENNKK